MKLLYNFNQKNTGHHIIIFGAIFGHFMAPKNHPNAPSGGGSTETGSSSCGTASLKVGGLVVILGMLVWGMLEARN